MHGTMSDFRVFSRFFPHGVRSDRCVRRFFLHGIASDFRIYLHGIRSDFLRHLHALGSDLGLTRDLSERPFVRFRAFRLGGGRRADRRGLVRIPVQLLRVHVRARAAAHRALRREAIRRFLAPFSRAGRPAGQRAYRLGGLRRLRVGHERHHLIGAVDLARAQQRRTGALQLTAGGIEHRAVAVRAAHEPFQLADGERLDRHRPQRTGLDRPACAGVVRPRRENVPKRHHSPTPMASRLLSSLGRKVNGRLWPLTSPIL